MTTPHIENDRPWYDSRTALPAPAARTDLRCEEIDDEAVLFDPQTGATFRLNATALFVWQQCQSSRPINDITRALAERYHIDLDHAADDVEQLLALFAAHGLLGPYEPARTIH